MKQNRLMHPAAMTRRSTLMRLAGMGGTIAAATVAPPSLMADGRVQRVAGTGITIALNAYSFNQPLRAGEMTLMDVVEYCALHEILALDATGYYFPGYPAVPSDDFLYALKRKGFVNGVTISGTGVRNDFAVTDATARANDVQLVKNWIEVAAKLGAGVIRVFSGRQVPEGHKFDEALQWMTPLFRECAEYGKRHGVIVGLQNHHDFVKTAEETIRIVEAVDSEWFGVILDVGSLRTRNVYQEIEQLIPYAVSWQLKENVWYGTKEDPIDLRKVKALIEKAGYRGYVPVETLGAGDAREKVARFRKQVRAELGI